MNVDWSTRRLGGLDVVVVGGGIVGTTLAHALARDGATVRLVEQRYPGAGTSGNTVAWLNAFGKQPRHYHDLNVRGIQAHQRLQEELGGTWLHLPGGWHWEDESGAGFCADLQETVQRLQAWGTEVEPMTVTDVARLEPGLRLDPTQIDEVFLVPREGWLYAGLMIQNLLRRARLHHGTELIVDRVCALSAGNGVQAVELASGRRLETDLVVVAAGAATDEIAALAGAEVPLRRTHGVLGVTAPAAAELQRVVIAPQVVARPDGAGRLLIATQETLDLPAGSSSTPTSGEVRRVLEAARQLIPDLAHVPLEALRHGTRVVPQDGLPVVGRTPDSSGPYVVVAHSGITLAAILAELVVEDLASGECPQLGTYRPDRFLPG